MVIEMLSWITENWSTIIICAVLCAALAAAAASLIRNKKKGKSSCGCGCSGCAMAGLCHKGEK